MKFYISYLCGKTDIYRITIVAKVNTFEIFDTYKLYGA